MPVHGCAAARFAAETMSALVDALAFRSLLAGALRPGDVGEGKARQLLPIVALTDCKSVYDAVHRVGGPRAPSEKRLVVDLVGLRQMIHAEQDAWSHEPGLEKAIRWVPTEFQLADALTKLKGNVEAWWSQLRRISLPFAGQGVKKPPGV